MRLATEKRDRRAYIGAHGAVAIAGMSPWANAADVYAQIVLGAVTPQTTRMLRGRIIEPGLVAYASEQVGRPIANDVHYRDDRVPFFGASVDGVEGDLDRPDDIHECKSTTTDYAMNAWGVEGTDDVERTAYMQAQWYMGITGARRTHVWLFVIDADEEPRRYLVPRSNTSIRHLRSCAEAFWYNHVLPCVPPAMHPLRDENIEVMTTSVKGDGSTVTVGDLPPRMLKALQKEGATALPADHVAAFTNAATTYYAAREVVKQATQQQKMAGAALAIMMGRHERAVFAGGSTTYRARGLPPVTDWEQVAHDVAIATNYSGERFIGLVKENTRPRKTSSRVLTVHIKKPKP